MEARMSEIRNHATLIWSIAELLCQGRSKVDPAVPVEN